jgi:hypothetical protein
MNIATLDRPVADLASELMAADLVTLEALIDAEKATLKRRGETFAAVMSRRFDEKAKAALLAAKKDTGTVHVEAGNGIDLTVNYPKKVEWDQKALRAAFDAMPEATARHYAKVKLEVEERKFTAAPPDVQKALLPARTVKVGKPSFSFKVTDAEAA